MRTLSVFLERGDATPTDGWFSSPSRTRPHPRMRCLMRHAPAPRHADLATGSHFTLLPCAPTAGAGLSTSGQHRSKVRRTGVPRRAHSSGRDETWWLLSPRVLLWRLILRNTML